MNRTWEKPTPLDMVCPDCRAKLPRGTTEHDCATVPIAKPVAVKITAVETPTYAPMPHRVPPVVLPTLVVHARCQFIPPRGVQCGARATWTISRRNGGPRPLCDTHAEKVRDLCVAIDQQGAA